MTANIQEGLSIRNGLIKMNTTADQVYKALYAIAAKDEPNRLPGAEEPTPR
jgi:hypothetical protein